MCAAIATAHHGTRTNSEVPQRWLSAPFSQLLADTPVTAAELDAELDTPAARRIAVTLRPPHPLIGSIRKASGLNVVEIGRRHRRLVVAVEEFGRRERSWFYREITRHTCIFGCPGTAPEQKKSTLIGGPLAALADPHPALNAALILQIDDTSDGWSEVRLDPDWVKF